MERPIGSGLSLSFVWTKESDALQSSTKSSAFVLRSLFSAAVKDSSLSAWMFSDPVFGAGHRSWRCSSSSRCKIANPRVLILTLGSLDEMVKIEKNIFHPLRRL